MVEMKIKREHAPIYKDASILLRPKTGLKDMFLELDPGNEEAGEIDAGDRVPVSETLPDVNPDEILAQLDADTRDYLRVLLNAGAEALEDDGPTDLRKTFKRFEPLSRDSAKATRLLIQRRRNIARTITNFQELATRARPKGQGPGGADRLGQRELRGDRGAGREPARGAAPVPGRARGDAEHAGQRLVPRRQPRPRAHQAAPGRPGARAVAAREPPVLPRHHARHPRPDPPVRPGRASRLCATSAAPRRTSPSSRRA